MRFSESYGLHLKPTQNGQKQRQTVTNADLGNKLKCWFTVNERSSVDLVIASSYLVFYVSKSIVAKISVTITPPAGAAPDDPEQAQRRCPSVVTCSISMAHQFLYFASHSLEKKHYAGSWPGQRGVKGQVSHGCGRPHASAPTFHLRPAQGQSCIIQQRRNKCPRASLMDTMANTNNHIKTHKAAGIKLASMIKHADEHAHPRMTSHFLPRHTRPTPRTAPISLSFWSK